MSAHLIIGCGYLGRRVAALWNAQGKRVYALTRGRSGELQKAGIEPIVGDVLDLASLSALPRASTVLYAVGMDRSTGRSFREVYLDGLTNVLERMPQPERLIYISSTSVYGQSQGELVDESSPTEPTEENGKIVLEAERLLREKVPEAIVLRFAGIYGPGRIIRQAALMKGEPLIGDADKWLNLIHVEDGARAVLAAESLAQPGETILIADGHPVRRREFYTFLAELLGAPPARFEPVSAGNPLPPHESANRRLSNLKMRSQLKLDVQYPDYRTGLQATVKKR